jgi:hypothetical protein
MRLLGVYRRRKGRERGREMTNLEAMHTLKDAQRFLICEWRAKYETAPLPTAIDQACRILGDLEMLARREARKELLDATKELIEVLLS